ncbi:hypothetical protein KDL01_13225 [Actinospica durhamensis]|uniref:YozE SAM-like domain-containing protein n=1 Tax=Actinospica durhamensis TaxID=1508375 RepID=A0A941EKP4_9ACTN|nr:hypothetical protein [Actinospica durhamensis]MBR7834230.1 hypothetical protein [Actinospica durhamensis]
MADSGDFTAWLEAHSEEEGALGSLARAAAADSHWPPSGDLQVYLGYLRDVGAGPEVESVCTQAWEKFLAP